MTTKSIYTLITMHPDELTVDECKTVLKAVVPMYKGEQTVTGEQFAKSITGKDPTSDFLRKVATLRLMHYNPISKVWAITDTIR